ncbi:Uncharacterized protein Adt_24872 [Abeliophyllum distichum]|uniref:Uncharacterized protein n=1 Tax=Abeliophyllum distichum TaxID=126358 RepID=A0ABD1SF07_9LAMI
MIIRISMEALLIHPSTDQSLSPYKTPFISRPSAFHTSGLKPHFLPLPIRNSRSSNNNNKGVGVPPHKGGHSDQTQTTVYQKQRDQSCPPVNRKTKYNGRRDQNSSHAFKKSKPSTNSPTSHCMIISSTNPWGPDSKVLPRNVTNFVSGKNSNSIISTTDSVCSLEAVENQVDKFSGSVASALSPPPSSLPLPTFTLRPKLSCNAEAAGIDIGATNNLRRLLRLQ